MEGKGGEKECDRDWEAEESYKRRRRGRKLNKCSRRSEGNKEEEEGWYRGRKEGNRRLVR